MIGDIRELRVIRYRRKSTEGDERQIASLPDQAVALDELAGRLGIGAEQIADDVEEAKSAKQPGRVGFNKRLIAAISEGKGNAILCWHPDRLSRNAIDTAALITLMDSGRLAAIITSQQVFWSSPMDKFMLALLCGQAKLENDNKSINVKRGLAGKIRKGWRPGPAPIGYLNNKAKERGERDIIVDEERFHLVRKVWDCFLTGNYSVRQIEDIARNNLCLRSRKTKKEGDRPLSLSHIYRILSDPFYYGSYLWISSETGKPELRQGRHVPMITEAEYHRAQALLGHREPVPSKKHLFTYRGMIHCGECGSLITAEEKWQIRCDSCGHKFSSQNRECCPYCDTKIADMKLKSVLHYVYYHCTRRKNPNCTQKGVRLENLEAQIEGQLKRFNIGEKYMRWAIESLREETVQNADEQRRIDAGVAIERRRIKDAITELNLFIVRQENSGWTLMKKEEVLSQRDHLENELREVEKRQNAGNQHSLVWFDSCVNVFEYASHALYWFREGSKEQKRAIIAALGSNHTLKDQKLNVDFTFPLKEIEKMVIIAPEVIGEFEPAKMVGQKTNFPPFEEKIPALLRSKNAIRTAFSRGLYRFAFLWD